MARCPRAGVSGFAQSRLGQPAPRAEAAPHGNSRARPPPKSVPGWSGITHQPPPGPLPWPPSWLSPLLPWAYVGPSRCHLAEGRAHGRRLRLFPGTAATVTSTVCAAGLTAGRGGRCGGRGHSWRESLPRSLRGPWQSSVQGEESCRAGTGQEPGGLGSLPRALGCGQQGVGRCEQRGARCLGKLHRHPSGGGKCESEAGLRAGGLDVVALGSRAGGLTSSSAGQVCA